MACFQGWTVGTHDDGAALIPFEVACQPGQGVRSHSGPVGEEMMESFLLAAWAAQLTACRLGTVSLAFDAHLHLPLREVLAEGPSCRLSFANCLLWCLHRGGLFAPAQTTLIGDL